MTNNCDVLFHYLATMSVWEWLVPTYIVLPIWLVMLIRYMFLKHKHPMKEAKFSGVFTGILLGFGIGLGTLVAYLITIAKVSEWGKVFLVASFCALARAAWEGVHLALTLESDSTEKKRKIRSLVLLVAAALCTVLALTHVV